MPDIFELKSLAGVRRDGTDLANMYYQDAQWVRFQRGLPRKMGGYRRIEQNLWGPVRNVFVDARASGYSAHLCSPNGVERVRFSQSGGAGSVDTRLYAGLAGFVASTNYTWQSTFMTQSGGSGTPTYIACATPDLDNIASDSAGGIWQADIDSAATLAQVSDGAPITVSGGVCVLQPFLFVYGSNGLIRNSNANDVSTATGWTTGGANLANSANPCGSKIVRGMAMRGGGQSPSGLFWSLDSLIRVSFIGGAAIWRYDTVTDDISILSKSCVVEYDSVYFWVGSDRFYMYNGTVQELPNDMNLNWFFDNLNYTQRQKVWALKVPRFGEIWWFFPFGDSTECDAAVIFNLREKTWYDARIQRTAGAAAKVFNYPLATGAVTDTVNLGYASAAPALALLAGATVTGVTSGAQGTILRNNATALELALTDAVGTFVSGETVTDAVSGNSAVLTSVSTGQATKLWQHEYGVDSSDGTELDAIETYYETTNFQWMSGGPPDGAPAGDNLQTRIVRVEPDFIMEGAMEVSVTGRSYAHSPKVTGTPETFTTSTEFVDFREQRREVALKFYSNEQGATFQAGRIFITAEPGDARG